MYSGITWRRTLLWAFLATILATLVGSSAFAQSDDGTEGASGDLAIFGQLDYEDPESGEDTAVVGVTIEVDGVGTVVTDDNGEFRIVVPGPGDRGDFARGNQFLICRQVCGRVDLDLVAKDVLPAQIEIAVIR